MLQIPKQPDLAYTEEGHAYTWKGAPILSITQILRSVGLSPDFRMVNKVELASAATRGSNVHSLTQFFDEDDLGEVAPEYAGYLDAWIKFRKDTGFIPEIREAMLYHTVFAYGGRPDAAGKLDGKLAVCEIKTGNTPAIDDWVGIQLALQQVLISDIAKYPVTERLAVKLMPSGDYNVRRFTDRRDRGIGLAAVTIANYKGV